MEIDNIAHDADVALSDVTSLSDRRKIVSLEARNADLEHKLSEAMSEAMGRVRPTVTIEHDRCLHLGTPQVHDRTELVTCGDCGVALNPYQILRRIAHREVNFCHQLQGLRDELVRVGKEVTSLKSTRARLRREMRAAKP
jgi:hypothetical protein